MNLGIAGRKAIVSGASRGIGLAVAQQLAQEGVDVTIVARDPQRLETAAADLRRHAGVIVTAIAVDITTPDGRAAVLAACPEPDILITNAAAPAPGDFGSGRGSTG